MSKEDAHSLERRGQSETAESEVAFSRSFMREFDAAPAAFRASADPYSFGAGLTTCEHQRSTEGRLAGWAGLHCRARRVCCTTEAIRSPLATKG
jgi:hypothetical protein